MSRFVLIHGSWHGGWCWSKVVALLEEAGHHAVAPDLPGHGGDETPVGQLTLDAYADRVCEVVAEQGEPVTLVGHSMGGAAITQAAERLPSSIRLLIYLAAYIPKDGSSVAQQAMEDSESLVSRHLVLDRLTGTVDLEAHVINDCFYADCSSEDVEFARARLRLDPLEPLMSPLQVSDERSGSVPSVYIECMKDRTLTPKMQRQIHLEHGCKKVFFLDTSHSPFFSAPESLVEYLLAAEALAGRDDWESAAQLPSP